MSWRYVVFALIIIFSVGYSWYSVEPNLIVHLRCDEEVIGTLSAKVILLNGVSEDFESFDIHQICKNGEIEIDEYQREKKIQFTFERDHGEKIKVTSEYGRDIQSDQNGFYMVLKITNAPPFIANDRI